MSQLLSKTRAILQQATLLIPGVKEAQAEIEALDQEDRLNICRHLGVRAVKGCCPEHHGDSCLIWLPGFVQSQEQLQRDFYQMEDFLERLNYAVERDDSGNLEITMIG